VGELSVTYLQSGWMRGVTQGTLSVFRGIDGLGAYDRRTPKPSIIGFNPEFTKSVLTITRLQALPQQFSLQAMAQIQRTKDKLLTGDQVVFGGSTNEHEWNKDPTGGRRFWPIEVTSVDLQGLATQRDQLFAEALVAFRAGAPCYPDRDQQRTLFDPEQLARQQSEGYVDALHDWVYSRTADFSMAEAVRDGLQMDYSKLTRDVQTRVGNALKALGCTRVERRNGTVRFWYRPPTRKAASSELTHAQQQSGGAHEPLPI
jgi:hypothetical protein